jgi:hypothetical protein
MALERVYINDTAVLEAFIYGEDEVTPLPATSVTYKVKEPDGTVSSIAGTLEDNNTEATAEFVPTQEGLHPYTATFTLDNGRLKSYAGNFEVVDPLVVLATSGIDTAVDHAMLKLEDLFDSELGGPWLQDKTVKSFDRRKLMNLLPDALYGINNYYMPITSFDETNFPTNHYPLVSQALMVEAIYHLIRSYTEQPLPAGSNISYFDRRDYQARWQSVLQKEEERLNQYIDIFKMEYTGFGATAVLVGGYATPITRMSRYWRMRNPKYIGPWT